MKRWIAIAMSLALCLAMPAGTLPAAAEEIYSEPVEAEILPAEEMGETGLIPEGAEEIIEDLPEPEPQTEPELPIEDASDRRYVRALREAAVLDDQNNPLATLAADTVALLLASGPRAHIAFWGPGGLMTGWADGDALALLSDDETRAYMDQAAQGSVVLYQEDARFPLMIPAADPAAPEAPAALLGSEALPPEIQAVAEGEIPEAGFRINPAQLTLGKKETRADLTAVAAPFGSLTWSSSDPKTVKVDPNTGAVTGAKIGTATITATAGDGSTASCAVTVVKAPSKLTLNANELQLSADGMTARLTVSIPEGSACGNFAFSSSKTSVVTVDQTGLITAVGPGKATVRVKSYNGKSAKCQVTVSGAAASVAFDSLSTAIAVGQTARLAPRALASNGAQVPSAFTFSVGLASRDPNCVVLNAETGEITGVRKGQATIIATNHRGLSAAIEVNVAAAPAAIALQPAELTIGAKETFPGVTPVLTPAAGETTCASSLTWRSENSKIAKVDPETGAITGVKKGTTTLVATTMNGLEARCKVTVQRGPKKIAVSPSELKMSADGMIARLTVTIPDGCAAAGFTYSSSKSSVAKVSADGLITAVGPGTATITVAAYNGKKATCKVTVSGVPARVAFEAESATLAVGQSLTLSPAAYAADGSKAAASYTYAVSANSADAGCVTLNASTGEITGARKGSATIVATAHNGLTASVTVNVVPAPVAVTLSASELTLGVKEKYAGLTAQLTPPNGESQAAGEIRWSTSNAKVAAVDAKTGAIAALKTGSATIIASCGSLEARCKVSVKKAPGKVGISPANGTLKVGQSDRYKISFPSKAGGSVKFTSSKPSVATVDDTGAVTAVGTGETTITVTTYNGKSAKAVLRVEPAETDLPANEYEDLNSATDQYDAQMTNAQKLEYVIYVAQKSLGKPYVYGAFGPDKFDCSGFVYYCFRQAEITLKDSAYAQGYDESQKKIERMADLKRGDLVFFDTEEDRDVSDHSGIYLGNGMFIHASSSARMVIISNLSTGYYSRTFAWGRRVLQQ